MDDTEDLENTHLCIKCSATIVGLEKYIEHRKQNCLRRNVNPPKQTVEPVSTSAQTRLARVSPSLNHSYESFAEFPEPEAPSSYLRKAAEVAASHAGKSSKSLTEAYELPYDLGADVFFSSLQLQSVSSAGPSTSGKTTTNQRHKEQREDESWHRHGAAQTQEACTDTLMKAVREIGESKKHDEAVFKPLKFEHDTPEISEEEDDDDEGDDFEPDDDDDEDYEPTRHRHSPPAVPASHTGGKWKPEHRPQLGVTQMQRISPAWDEPEPETPEANAGEHPPAEHTKGKWVPGSKVQRLEYRENIDLTKLRDPTTYWCNICCRNLKNRNNYKHHLHSRYHKRRAEAERQLEQAALSAGSLHITKEFNNAEPLPAKPPLNSKPMRRRRANLLRCDLCRHSFPHHLLGKHLISHYHYRRLQQLTHARRQSYLHNIIEQMPSIVKQAPFQCRPCQFYACTEQAFLAHWHSEQHELCTAEHGGNFWCSYCQFECPSNENMWCHLVSNEHKEVLLAVNRSVPIYISQRRPIACSICFQTFLYNMELRQHFATAHVEKPPTGTASDDYQSRFECNLCGQQQRSLIALQRHEKHKHRVTRYYCAICQLEFGTALEARRHRGQMQHKRLSKAQNSDSAKLEQPLDEQQDIEHLLREVLGDQREVEDKPAEEKKVKATKSAKKRRMAWECSVCRQEFDSNQALKQHRSTEHAQDNHICPSCGCNFETPQSLGRHTRHCQPTASTSKMDNKAASNASGAAPSTPSLWHCEKCSFSSHYKSDLLYHRFFHTRANIGKKELLQCPLCVKKFPKYSLRAHLRNHTEERIFACDQCDTKFSRRHNLKAHIAKIHAVKGDANAAAETEAKSSKKPNTNLPKQTFKCGSCDKILANKYTLKQHELVHNEQKASFACHHKDCKYTATTAVCLKVHLASHGKGSYVCDRENCSYVGKTEFHLKRHIKSHIAKAAGEGDTSLKWYSCDRCKFRSHIKGHLRRHMRSHTGDKPYQCQYCEFQCSTFDNLRKHILKTNKHPGKFIYECPTCEASTNASETVFKSNSYKEYQTHLLTHK